MVSGQENTTPAEAAEPLSDNERRKRQRTRSIVLALVLAGLVIVFYAITLVQLGHQSDAVDAAAEAQAEAAATVEASQ